MVLRIILKIYSTEGVFYVLDKLRSQVRFPYPYIDLIPERKDFIQRQIAMLLDMLQAERAQGKVVLLAHAPHIHAIRDKYDRYDEHLLPLLRQSGMPFLELRNAIQKREDIYFDDVHMNAAGHELYAQAMAEALIPWLTAPKETTP